MTVPPERPQPPEEKNTAIFDFDGVLYSGTARWKIIDARLGVVGSRVTWEAGLRIYDQAAHKFEGIQLTECFAPDEFEFATVRENAANLTLPRHLMKTAQNHNFRGHDLFVLSRYAFRDFLRVNERFMGQPGPLPMKGNPFEHSRLLVTEDYSAAHANTALSLQEKFRMLGSMLLRDESEDASAPTDTYTRIYLYYTEPAYIALTEEFLRNERESLAGGRNAIVTSYIADIPE